MECATQGYHDARTRARITTVVAQERILGIPERILGILEHILGILGRILGRIPHRSAAVATVRLVQDEVEITPHARIYAGIARAG